MLIDHTNKPMMRLRVNRTRQANLSGPTLAEAHRSVGAELATSLAGHLILEETPIEHVTGPSTGVQIKPGSELIVIAMMRAGLFVAEGIWASIPGSTLVLQSVNANLQTLLAKGRSIVVVDSVINTGNSIRNVLAMVNKLEPSCVAVATLVAFRDTLDRLVDEFPDVDFHVARVSDHSYVGKGPTDTGSRLFGTTSWDLEI